MMIPTSAQTHSVTANASSVTSGNVVAGSLVRAACGRHLDDLAASADPDFPYEFDAEAADLVRPAPHRRRPGLAHELHKQHSHASDTVKKIKDDAAAELADIVAGQASLGLPSDPPVDSTRPMILTSPSRRDRLKLSLTIDSAEEAAKPCEVLAARLQKSPRDLLREIAEDWATRVFPDLFERGGDPPWEPLSPKTIEIHDARRPLEGRGILRRSIRVMESGDSGSGGSEAVGSEAVVGSEIGIVHLRGAVTGADSILPGREIPVRDFLSVPDAEVSTSFERIFSFYFGDL